MSEQPNEQQPSPEPPRDESTTEPQESTPPQVDQPYTNPAPSTQAHVTAQGFPQQPTQPYNQEGQPPFPPNDSQYYQENQPYGQIPYQQPPFDQQTHYYNQPPYGQPYQPPYQQQSTQKKKVWPWVLIGCILVFVLGVGGCTSCVAYNVLLDRYDDHYSYYDDHDYYYDDYDDYYDDYYDYYGDQYDSYSDSYSSGYGYTLEEIRTYSDQDFQNEIEDGSCTNGIYEVGNEIDPGLYYLEGSQDDESYFTVYRKSSSSEQEYDYEVSVYYFGNYYYELTENDVIVYGAPDNAHMYPADTAEQELTEPYESGCYLVGTDIPAGTYTVTYKDNLDIEISQESAAYVMQDLEFNEDSILESNYLLEGTPRTITVTDGQYVELYMATMTAQKA